MSSPDQIWIEAAKTLERGKPFALATVVNVRGSTPREIGAKMLVRGDGQVGTIGGGCGEAEVFRKAQLVLEHSGAPRIEEVDLTGDFDQQQIGTCGGIMDVFVDLWLPERDRQIARELADASLQNQPIALVTLVQAGNTQAETGARTLLRPNESGAAISTLPVQLPRGALADLLERVANVEPALLEIEAGGKLREVSHIDENPAPRLFVDPLPGAQRLIIVGAGHIAQPLCALASMLGYHTVVIDDRASFANRERFPQANEIIVKPFETAINALKLDRQSFVVMVTRGHAFDETSLRAALKQKARFVGMIGSRRRVKATLDRLEADGFSREQLAQVHAPIGLDIGAETPEEIAVAIIAEIVRERRRGLRDEFTMGVKLGRLTPSN
jgi:xanthine dehydrogenase accessory factor